MGLGRRLRSCGIDGPRARLGAGALEVGLIPARKDRNMWRDGGNLLQNLRGFLLANMFDLFFQRKFWRLVKYDGIPILDTTKSTCQDVGREKKVG